MIKPNTKIRILSPEHSAYVQKLAFESGFSWSIGGREVSHQYAYSLHFWNDKDVSYGDVYSFEGDEKEEIFIDMPAEPSIESRILAEKVGAKHSHYFKDVSDLDEIDVYRVCDLFEVNDSSGAKQHAIKKLLCSGKRGAKDERKDLEEARDTIIRKLAMMNEDRE